MPLINCFERAKLSRNVPRVRFSPNPTNFTMVAAPYLAMYLGNLNNSRKERNSVYFVT